jgi:hypothetical protein
MKKNLMIVMTGVLLVASVIVAGCSKGYETKKTADELIVTLKADRYPLIKGDNNLFINVTDATGKIVPDVTVKVRYYMPPMPGMAPMEFNATPQAKSNSYVFTANIPMEGGWKVDVTAARLNKNPVTLTFNVDAR